MDEQNKPTQPDSSEGSQNPVPPQGFEAQPAQPATPATPATPPQPAAPAAPPALTQPVGSAAPADPTQPVAPQQPGVPQPTQPVPQQPVPPQAPASPYGQQPVDPYGQQQAPYGAPQPSAPGYYQPVAAQSGKATGALVCGILAILFSWAPLFGIILGIVAIVLAGKAVKEAGKNGKTTGGKVCGIVGIVLSIIVFILAVIIGFTALGFLAGNSDARDSLLSSSNEPSTSLPSVTSPDPDEKQMRDAVTAKLDLLKNKDAATMQYLADEADARMKTITDFSLSELGVDPMKLVDWMLTDFEYEFNDVYDNSDGAGVAYIDLKMRDTMAFANAFMEDAQAAIDAGKLEGLDEVGSKALLGELYLGAMEKTTDMTSDYIALDLVKSGDTWQVDEDSWNEELEYLFGL